MLTRIVGGNRHTNRLLIVIVALLATGLAGCETGVQAAGRNSLVAQTTAVATDANSGPSAWVDAGQVTVTPAAAATAVSEKTATPAATDSAAEGDDRQPVQFAGKVENLPGSGDWSGAWQVGGRLVHVTPTTTVDQQAGRLDLGSQVAIEGWQRPDSSVDAGWITVLGPLPSSTPAAPIAGTTPQPALSGGNSNEPATATPPATAAITPAATAGDANEAGRANDAGEVDKNNKDDESQEADKDNEDNEDNGQTPADNARPARPVEFRGTVDQLPQSGLVGDWRVDGRTVHVNGQTRVQQKQGAIARGAYVQVMGWQQPDGSINAASIQTKKVEGKGNNGQGQSNEDGQTGNGKDNGKAKDNGKSNGKDNGKGNGKDNGKGNK